MRVGPARSELTIDLSGLTVMPGWIDTHIHVTLYLMSQGTYYFRHTYESASLAAQLVLKELARGGEPSMMPDTIRWLTRRGLTEENGRLAIPVLGAFMREELGLR